MPNNAVNLDALIPREDFAVDDVRAGGSPRTNISISDLDDGFFSTSLRKPDFQRETTHWTPRKIVDLVKAFLNVDLIPAVILWQRGGDIFVIDGAHRLSAIIAWVRDDYGDRRHSLEYFGGQIPPEQAAMAEKTRALIRREIGTYAEFQGLRKSRDTLPPDKQQQIATLGSNSVQVQWVPAAEPRVAELSFFKINQAAQPIDPIERMILQSRESANAIAARCIVRGARGHRYWARFEKSIQDEVESLGKEIFDALFSGSPLFQVGSLSSSLPAMRYVTDMRLRSDR